MGFLTNHDYNSMQEDLQEVIDGSETLEQCAIDGSVRDRISISNALDCKAYIAGWEALWDVGCPHQGK